MKDLVHEKFACLIDEVENLEIELEKQEQSKTVGEDQLIILRNTLAEKRNELARLSDGCGPLRGAPHGGEF